MIYGLLLVSILSFPNVGAQNNSNFTVSNEIPEPPVPKPKVDVSIEGTSADDKIRGGEGDDEISGNKGDDILSGHEGNDELDGGSGDDQLDGGEGTDELEGGKGEDLFICDEQDTVIDFNSLENDEKQGSCEIIDRALAERQPFSGFENGGREDLNDGFNDGFNDDQYNPYYGNPYQRLY